ncbi:MAG: hypothetical protein V7637_4660 [Mycobacteriales bacterium]
MGALRRRRGGDRDAEQPPRPAAVPARTGPPGGLTRQAMELQALLGNAGVARLLGQRDPGGLRPLQRRILTGHGSSSQEITTAAGVRLMPEVQGLHPAQLDRLIALAEDDQEYIHIINALDQTRNTVVGAVDGGRGGPEGAFLKSAWDWRRNVSAYDPAMKTDALRAMLNKEGLPPATAQLTHGSITQFGQHVPYTDVLVPHPGPWVIDVQPPDDLASCLETVMGPNSRAWVLTDNETSKAYATTLVQRITAINQANATRHGYRPLVVAEVKAVVPTDIDGQPTTMLGEARLLIGHQPYYRLIRITRT